MYKSKKPSKNFKETNEKPKTLKFFSSNNNTNQKNKNNKDEDDTKIDKKNDKENKTIPTLTRSNNKEKESTIKTTQGQNLNNVSPYINKKSNINFTEENTEVNNKKSDSSECIKNNTEVKTEKSNPLESAKENNSSIKKLENMNEINKNRDQIKQSKTLEFSSKIKTYENLKYRKTQHYGNYNPYLNKNNESNNNNNNYQCKNEEKNKVVVSNSLVNKDNNKVEVVESIHKLDDRNNKNDLKNNTLSSTTTEKVNLIKKEEERIISSESDRQSKQFLTNVKENRVVHQSNPQKVNSEKEAIKNINKCETLLNKNYQLNQPKVNASTGNIKNDNMYLNSHIEKDKLKMRHRSSPLSVTTDKIYTHKRVSSLSPSTKLNHEITKDYFSDSNLNSSSSKQNSQMDSSIKTETKTNELKLSEKDSMPQNVVVIPPPSSLSSKSESSNKNITCLDKPNNPKKINNSTSLTNNNKYLEKGKNTINKPITITSTSSSSGISSTSDINNQKNRSSINKINMFNPVLKSSSPKKINENITTTTENKENIEGKVNNKENISSSSSNQTSSSSDHKILKIPKFPMPENLKLKINMAKKNSKVVIVSPNRPKRNSSLSK